MRPLHRRQYQLGRQSIGAVRFNSYSGGGPDILLGNGFKIGNLSAWSNGMDS